MTASTLHERLGQLRARIAAAEQAHGRPAGTVQLLAVTKTQPVERLREALQTGLLAFGENYLQEAIAKQDALADAAITWHFIGALQSNKTADIAARFAWVHSIDRLRIAGRLASQRPASLGPLHVCLQVNISGETRKSGVAPAELPELAERIAALPGLRLRGLMALPAPAGDSAAQRRPLAALRRLYDDLIARGHALDTLSMGTSDDLEAAIAEGSTLLRIGTALFGPRRRV